MNFCLNLLEAEPSKFILRQLLGLSSSTFLNYCADTLYYSAPAEQGGGFKTHTLQEGALAGTLSYLRTGTESSLSPDHN